MHPYDWNKHVRRQFAKQVSAKMLVVMASGRK